MLTLATHGRTWPGPGEELLSAVAKTSWGWIGAVASPRGLRQLTLPCDERDDAQVEVFVHHGRLRSRKVRFAGLFATLERYFAGERVTFDFPLDPWGSEFQVAVWETLRRIPYGETRSYGDVAREVGRPLGAQAVGQAVGRNPLAIVVPCHRVIATDGTLGGFGGGGLDLEERLQLLDLKRRLLLLEGVHVR